MKIRYIIPALIDQLPLMRLLRNAWRGHLIGLFHERSHLRNEGQPKVGYNTKASAARAAETMKKKWGKHFSSYRCVYCGKFHLGKNRENHKHE